VVLVSFRCGWRVESGRPHADRARRQHDSRPLPVCVRLLPASRGRTLHGLRAPRREDVELIAHLGDYIYEAATNPSAPPESIVKRHQEWEPTTLAQYRDRYALYKIDPALQAAHAAFPWVVTWDDHEVANNYAGAVSAGNDLRDEFRQARAAYQAYYEHQPLRKADSKGS
jgi:phosphodiesterase/alkaline phosphatase D-like protein